MAFVQRELSVLTASLLTGAGLMAAYDVLRALRAFLPHKALIMGIEDIVYWIAAGFRVFYLLYREQDGVVRLYVIGLVLGTMVVYDRMCSANLQKLLKKLWKYLKMKKKSSDS